MLRKVNHGKSEEGNNDDLMMCLVIFGWLSNQAYFKELTDTNARQQLYEEQQNLIEQDMSLFVFVDDGTTRPREMRGRRVRRCITLLFVKSL